MFKRISKLALAVAFMVSGLSINAYSQAVATRPAPQCRQSFQLTAVSATTTGTAGYDNRPVVAPGTFDKGGCDTWLVEYHVTGFSAAAFEVDGAPDSSGAAGTFHEWVTAGGSMITGTFPISSTTQGSASFKEYLPWIQVVLNSKTGTGSVTGVLYGWVTNPNSNLTLTGDVTIDIATLAKESGGNLAAIATVFGSRTDAKSTSTDSTSTTLMQVEKQISASIQAAAASLAGTLTVGSHAVTNAGTFVTQATLSAETTKVIGTVNIAAGQTIGISGVPHVIIDSGGGGGSTAQGASISGVTGGLSMGSVTTAAPTYTNATVNGLSLDITGALRVNVTSGSTGNAAAGATGSAVPSQAGYNGVNIGGTLRGQTGTNPSGVVYAADVNITGGPGIVYNGTQPTKADGETVSDLQVTSRGELKVAPGVSGFATTATLSAETTKVIGTVNIAASQTIAVTNAGTFVAQSQPTAVTSGGAVNTPVEILATDNHQVLKNGAGQIYWIHSFNIHSAAMYLRFYNAGTGFNGCGSATNLVWEGTIPADPTGAGFVVDIGVGMYFSTGISMCATGAYGNTDTTNAIVSKAVVNIGIK